MKPLSLHRFIPAEGCDRRLQRSGYSSAGQYLPPLFVFCAEHSGVLLPRKVLGFLCQAGFVADITQGFRTDTHQKETRTKPPAMIYFSWLSLCVGITMAEGSGDSCKKVLQAPSVGSAQPFMNRWWKMICSWLSWLLQHTIRTAWFELSGVLALTFCRGNSPTAEEGLCIWFRSWS